MRDFSGKRYWLIGASDGLGAALAKDLSKAGATVILSARNKAALDTVAKELSGPCSVVPVDVQDNDSIASAVNTIGEVDGIVYLAGVYWPMAAQDWDHSKALAMIDVNFTGAMRVLGHVLPSMIARNSGHIVLTGSLSAYRGLPAAIGYSASKAGLLGLAESLYYDLKSTNVDVQIAHPGFIKTRLTDKNDFKMPSIMTPGIASDHMMAHMRSKSFNCAFPRPFSWVFRGAQFLPNWLYYRLFS